MSIWTPDSRDYNESATCRHGVNQFAFCKECQAVELRREAKSNVTSIAGDTCAEQFKT